MDLAEIKKSWTEEFELPNYVVDWLIAEVEKLATEREELWQELNAMQDRAEKAEASLTLSCAEGKREGLERAMVLMSESVSIYTSADNLFADVESAIEQEIAAIREAAQEKPVKGE